MEWAFFSLLLCASFLWFGVAALYSALQMRRYLREACTYRITLIGRFTWIEQSHFRHFFCSVRKPIQPLWHTVCDHLPLSLPRRSLSVSLSLFLPLADSEFRFQVRKCCNLCLASRWWIRSFAVYGWSRLCRSNHMVSSTVLGMNVQAPKRVFGYTFTWISRYKTVGFDRLKRNADGQRRTSVFGIHKRCTN